MAAWLLLGCAVAALPAPAQQDFESVEIRTVPVARDLHMLIGRGGNIAVVSGPDGVFLVDDEYAPLSEKIRAAVAAIHSGPIRFVLNTHWHRDHTGGNENFGKTGAVLIAHEHVRERMTAEQVMTAFGRTIPPAPAGALPVVTFPDELTLYQNGIELVVEHHRAAHTDGDSVVWFRGRDAVHMGDIYFNDRYPFIDVDSGGSVAGVIEATDRVLAHVGETTKIIPGHGALSNRAELSAYREMLSTVRERAAAALAAGQSVADFVATEPTAEFDAVWGQGSLTPETFQRILYADLARAEYPFPEKGERP